MYSSDGQHKKELDLIALVHRPSFLYIKNIVWHLTSRNVEDFLLSFVLTVIPKYFMHHWEIDTFCHWILSLGMGSRLRQHWISLVIVGLILTSPPVFWMTL